MLDKISEAGSNKATFFELLGGVEQVMLKLAEALHDIADFMRNQPELTC